MSLSTNTKKILELFNKMQKAITNFDVLNFPHEYIAYEIYKIHIEALMIYIEDDIKAKLSLALFRQLFENANDFNEYSDKKAEYIELLIDQLNAKGTDDEEDVEIELESKIITMLFNIRNEDDKMLVKSLFIKLQKKLKIKTELYYLLLILLEETGLNLHILIDYLPQILKEKYPDSIFDFSEVLETGMKFGEFTHIFLSAIDSEENYDYAIFQFNKEKKTILISHKSIDEISNIILSASSEKKNTHKKKSIKEKTEKKIIDKETKETKNDNKQKLENNNEKVSEEKAGENIQYLNEKEKDKINDTKSIDIHNKEKKDEIQNISMEGMRKIIKNNQISNAKNQEKIEKLENDNKKLMESIEKLMDEIEQLKDETKQLRNNNKQMNNDIKQLNKKIQDINCSLSNKIMQNKKKLTLLEFDIKTIGLRDAYKPLIDLLIFIMNLDVHGNIEAKIASISKVIQNLNNKNVEKIKKLLKDTSDLITHANNKAYYIKFDEDIIKQLIFNLSKFSGNKEYLSLIDILKNMKIENELELLVKNRFEKFTKSKEDFIKNQIKIKEAIQNNHLISNGNNGNGFATLINS